MNRTLFASVALAMALTTCDPSWAKGNRNPAEKHLFEKSNPCPATGKSSGPCKGYVIDHVVPLDCGGADAPSNMQWQTTADGKAKDKVEREGANCKHRQK